MKTGFSVKPIVLYFYLVLHHIQDYFTLETGQSVGGM